MNPILLAVALATPALATSPSTPGAAECLALSQKACREFLFIASGIDSSDVRGDLTDSISSFDSLLETFTTATDALPPRAKDRAASHIADIRATWRDVRSIYTAAATGTAPNDAELGMVATLTSTLYQNLDTLSRSFDPAPAARRAALAEKMSCEFLFITLGVNADQLRTRLQTTMATFTSTLSTEGPEVAQTLAHFNTLEPVFTKATNAGWTPTSGDAALIATNVPRFAASITMSRTPVVTSVPENK